LGAPVAYHISECHPYDYTNNEDKSVRVSAIAEDGSRQVFHIFTRIRPGLTRGVPYLAPVIESLKQIDRYTEAEIMSAVISSMFTIFVKSEEEEGLSAMTPISETGGSIRDNDYKIAPGAILDLQPNESIEIADPKRPNQAFDGFVQAILRQVGVALEIPFEILIKHFTASYSAAQAALVEAWKFFSSKRRWLADSFCQPVYELVISEAIATGLLKAPGFFSNPLVRAAFLGAVWIGPPRGQIDQLKEINAAETRLMLGISTLAEETAQITGGDWERKHPQSAKEHRMRLEAGLIGSPSEISPSPSKE
jgi:lambda family phage portal protein